MEVNQNLTSAAYDALFELNKTYTILVDAHLYRKLIGKLLYLIVTRPDIVFVVQKLSQVMQAPKQSHLDAVFRVIKYIKN